MFQAPEHGGTCGVFQAPNNVYGGTWEVFQVPYHGGTCEVLQVPDNVLESCLMELQESVEVLIGH